MNSTLSQLRSLIGYQLAISTIDTTTDPSSTIIDKYINIALKRIARQDEPSQLFSRSEINYNVTASQRYIELVKPSDYYRLKINASAALTGTWTVGNAVTDGTYTATITEVGTQYVEVNSATGTSWSGTLTNSTTAATATISSVNIIQPILIPKLVYYKQSSGKYKELRQLNGKEQIFKKSASKYFDGTTETTDPNYYSTAQNGIVFDVNPASSLTNGCKIMGILEPKYLVNDTDENDLSDDYDLYLAYYTCFLFYQRDDDYQNQAKFQTLMEIERNELNLSMNFNESGQVELDPYTFTNQATNIANPSIFFGS